MKGYKVDFKYENDIELLDTLLYIYTKSVLKKDLSEKRRIILREYLINGYTDITKKSICMNLGMKMTNLNTQNHTLQEMGFLMPHPTTRNKKNIDESLLNLRDTFINAGGKRIFYIEFNKK
jgi:hypothetical protein